MSDEIGLESCRIKSVTVLSDKIGFLHLVNTGQAPINHWSLNCILTPLKQTLPWKLVSINIHWILEWLSWKLIEFCVINYCLNAARDLCRGDELKLICDGQRGKLPPSLLSGFNVNLFSLIWRLRFSVILPAGIQVTILEHYLPKFRELARMLLHWISSSQTF